MNYTPNKLYKEPVDHDWSDFSERLRTLMDSYGFNQAALAEKTGLNVASISRYLNGRAPDLLAIWRIADYFDVTIDWLCGRIPSKFESLNDEQATVLHRYTLASPEDKNIVNLFLSKYADE